MTSFLLTDTCNYRNWFLDFDGFATFRSSSCEEDHKMVPEEDHKTVIETLQNKIVCELPSKFNNQFL